MRRVLEARTPGRQPVVDGLTRHPCLTRDGLKICPRETRRAWCIGWSRKVGGDSCCQRGSCGHGCPTSLESVWWDAWREPRTRPHHRSGVPGRRRGGARCGGVVRRTSPCGEESVCETSLAT